MSEENPSEFVNQFLGSTTANLLFTLILGFAAWLKSRCQTSNCQIHAGICECDSSLSELGDIKETLTTTQNTQRNMLKDILALVNGKEGITVEPSLV